MQDLRYIKYISLKCESKVNCKGFRKMSLNIVIIYFDSAFNYFLQCKNCQLVKYIFV